MAAILQTTYSNAPVDSPHKGPAIQNFDVSLDKLLNNQFESLVIWDTHDVHMMLPTAVLTLWEPYTYYCPFVLRIHSLGGFNHWGWYKMSDIL